MVSINRIYRKTVLYVPMYFFSIAIWITPSDVVQQAAELVSSTVSVKRQTMMMTGCYKENTTTTSLYYCHSCQALCISPLLDWSKG